jgi:hypothetical protein
MSDESSQDRHMKELWQGQPTEGVRMSIEQVQASAGSFQRKIQWRNAREYVAAFVVVVFFGFQFVRTGDLGARMGFGLLIAGMCYMVWQLHSRGSWRAVPKDAALSSCIEFKRRELERQRDLLSHIWSWYLGPLIPGLAVLIVDFAFASQGRVRHNGLLVAAYSLFVAGIFIGIAKLNSRAASTLQKQIDELDEAGR